MESTDKKAHWENIYQTKQLTEVSWYQPKPITALGYIAKANLPKDAAIIDMGGGDSFLADYLLEEGYTDITVLDIAQAAIERAKARLGANAAKIQWIVADAANFTPTRQYDFWFDRAAFHFLTNDADIANYTRAAAMAIKPGGHLVVGTFSDQGPKKCSGIEIKQYTDASLAAVFSSNFDLISYEYINHETPFNTVQNFIFCSFKRRV